MCLASVGDLRANLRGFLGSEFRAFVNGNTDGRRSRMGGASGLRDEKCPGVGVVRDS
jgi:hypothetical protein